MSLYLLYESSAGLCLFENVRSSSINPQQDSFVVDFHQFGQVVKLKSFSPFSSAEDALENINAISEGDPTKFLIEFLQANLPKGSKKKDKEKEKEKEKDKDKHDVILGVMEPKLGSALSDVLSVKCKSDDKTNELYRGIRLHLLRFLNELKGGDLFQSQLGLSHSYSRSKVKFNIHRVDNMIIQSSALLDQLDKDLNTFAMRVREWYSYHFPELYQVVPDQYLYAKAAHCIKNKSVLVSHNALETPVFKELVEILQDEEKAKQVVEAAKMSMGQDINPIDLINIEAFATRVVKLSEFRKKLSTYLQDKMSQCAPNLSSLIGEQVGARLISHAGSLTNLAKYPASTVQILGAEKALFRALKSKSTSTPKYGLIFHSTFIGRAGQKNKGRISRYLANKCSIAARIDCFSDFPTSIYGSKLRQQVEERLEFYKTGKAPRKNVEVMKEAIKEVRQTEKGEGNEDVDGDEGKKKKKDKKRKHEEEEKEVSKEEEKSKSKDKGKEKSKGKETPKDSEDEPKTKKPKKDKKKE